VPRRERRIRSSPSRGDDHVWKHDGPIRGRHDLVHIFPCRVEHRYVAHTVDDTGDKKLYNAARHGERRRDRHGGLVTSRRGEGAALDRFSRCERAPRLRRPGAAGRPGSERWPLAAHDRRADPVGRRYHRPEASWGSARLAGPPPHDVGKRKQQLLVEWKSLGLD
jgi:hypothetical protein